jgi:hypothetical protein
MIWPIIPNEITIPISTIVGKELAESKDTDDEIKISKGKISH